MLSNFNTKSHRRHRQRSRIKTTRMPRRGYEYLLQFGVAIIPLISLSSHSVVQAEDFGQAFSHTENGSRGSGDETYIVASFSAFLAFCILSVMASISYFSTLEETLIKRYQEEGELVEADVVSAEFVRAGTGTRRWNNNNQQTENLETEYTLFVEYKHAMADNSYVTTVRKQVKAREGDIKNLNLFTLSTDGYEEGVSFEHAMELRDMLKAFGDDHTDGHKGDLGKIDMLVMENFPLSGLSRNHVERSRSTRFRLPSIALFMSGIGLAIFCIRLAAQAIANSDIHDEKKNVNLVSLYLIGVFVLLIGLELVILHCCLKKTLVAALEEEYLKSGELIPSEDIDDSSLSTGSDFFLGTPAQRPGSAIPSFTILRRGTNNSAYNLGNMNSLSPTTFPKV